MTITRPDGTTYQLPVDIPVGSVHVEELMVSDYIEIPFRTDTYVSLPAGSYITFGNVRYTLTEPYEPTRTDELEYSYKPRFNAPFMLLSGKPLFLYTETSSGTLKEPDWSLTDFLSNHIACILTAIEEETGVTYTAQVDQSFNEAKTVSYQSLDILSGLNAICTAFGCEWCVRGTVLHVGNISIGQRGTLTVGTNVSAPTVSKGGDGYANRYYVFGSTRNIVQKVSGAGVNNIVNRRLTLNPDDYPEGYIDTEEDNDNPISRFLVFDSIYPNGKLKLSDVSARLLYRLDGDGKKIVVGTDAQGDPVYDMYCIWYVKLLNHDDTPFEFDNSVYDEDDNPSGMMMPGLDIMLHMNSGALNGFEFTVNYFDEAKTFNTIGDVEPFTVEAGMFEIAPSDSNGLTLPAISGLVPQDDDQVVLVNINMPEEYVENAQDELAEAALAEIARRSGDLDHYTVRSYPHVFETSNPGLYIGRAVTFINGGRTIQTRVTSLKTQLDYGYEQEITIGNGTIKGSSQQLRDEVVVANQNISDLSTLNKAANSVQAILNKLQQDTIANIGEFSKWFTPHYDSNGVLVSLECNTALWTEMWLSAFGPSSTEGGEGGASILAELLDVIASSTNPELVKGLTGDPDTDNGKVLTYSAEDDGWVAAEGGQGGGGDKNYVHVQGTSAKIWSVQHNLGKYPSVTIVDYDGNEVIGSVKHNSVNDLTITFNVLVDGKAFCN